VRHTKSDDLNPLLYLFDQVWKYSKDSRKIIVLFWFMFFMAEIVDMVFLPMIWAKIMNNIQQYGVVRENIPYLLKLLAFSFCGTVGFWLFHGPARVMETVNAFNVKLNYRKFLLKGVVTMPLGWHNDHHSGDTIDKIEKGTNSIFNFAESSFQIIYAIVSLGITLVMLAYVAGWAVLGMFPPMLLSVWITMRFDKVIIENYKALSRNENNVSESVFDAISNITTVIILRVEKIVFDSIIIKVEKVKKLFVKNQMLVETKWFLTAVCAKLVTISVLSVYFYQKMGNPNIVMLGEVYLVIRYVQNVGELFFRFTSVYGDVIKQRARVSNAEILSNDFVDQNFSNHVLPKNWQELEVRNLNFSYDNDSEKTHLQDVGMRISRGEKIAFVGERGSGKTTTLKLVRDLYQPQNIDLYADGAHIEEGFKGIERAISLVPQDPELFTASIWDNITMMVDYPKQLVQRFTDMACFTSVALGLPKGFESMVNEKGVNLSGGQKQGLALARGLLASHDKDIVLLDEPTSSLDLATEQAVYRNIFHGFVDKTVISTIHRLHLLPLFDTVYMFRDGKIVCSGHVDDLIKNCPEFKELWDKQHTVTV